MDRLSYFPLCCWYTDIVLDISASHQRFLGHLFKEAHDKTMFLYALEVRNGPVT